MNKKLLILSLFSCLCLLEACGGGTTEGSTASTTPAGDTPPPPPPTLTITSAAPPSGKIGDPYEGGGFQLAASGGEAPYRWNWVAAPDSSTPNGLEITTTGLISGTPTVSGTFMVIITVLDAESHSAQVSQNFTITIDGAVTFAITSGAPPNGIVGVDYGPTVTEYFSCRWSPVLGWHQVCTECPSSSACAPMCTSSSSVTPCSVRKEVFVGFTFTAAGGTPPYTWSASGLPIGLDVDPSTGQLVGTPTEAGSFSVNITVTDAQPTPFETSVNYPIDIVNPTTHSDNGAKIGMVLTRPLVRGINDRRQFNSVPGHHSKGLAEIVKSFSKRKTGDPKPLASFAVLAVVSLRSLATLLFSSKVRLLAYAAWTKTNNWIVRSLSYFVSGRRPCIFLGQAFQVR